MIRRLSPSKNANPSLIVSMECHSRRSTTAIFSWAAVRSDFTLRFSAPILSISARVPTISSLSSRVLRPSLRFAAKSSAFLSSIIRSAAKRPRRSSVSFCCRLIHSSLIAGCRPSFAAWRVKIILKPITLPACIAACHAGVIKQNRILSCVFRCR